MDSNTKNNWEVHAKFKFNGSIFEGKWFIDDTSTIDNMEDAKTLAEYCNGKEAYIQEINTKRKSYPPPLLHNLTSLQAQSSKRFKMDYEKTKNAAQNLYQKGYISNPLTNFRYLTNSVAITVPSILTKIKSIKDYTNLIPSTVVSLENTQYVNSSSNQHAIIPTDKNPILEQLTKEERNIYDIIVRSLISIHCDQAVFDYSTILTVVDDKFTFTTKGRLVIREGWGQVLYPKNERNTDNNDYIDTPMVEADDTGEVLDAFILDANNQNKPAQNSKSKENHSRDKKQPPSFTNSKRTTQVISSESMPVGKCRLCGSDVVDKGNFYGCVSYQTNGCGFTIGKQILGKDIPKEEITLLLDNGNTTLMEGFNHRNGKGTFKAVLSWDSEQSKLIFKRPNPNIFRMPLDLLKPLVVYEPPKDDMMREFKKIEDEAAAVKLPAKVVSVKNGPRITRFELLPDKGINISGYKRFKANFQAELEAKKISMYIPIPGTNRVGLEIPNKNGYAVQLRGLLEDEHYQAIKTPLTIPLGMDTYGNPYFANLEDMPHLLVAGSTGSGKSVFLNSVILSLLYGQSPEELKFMFIDPKQVELSVYKRLPHLFSPIITDVRKASKALEELIREMETRYNTFKEYGVRNIAAYNKKIEAENGERMPFICLIIDEVADLIMTTDSSVEDKIARLSQLARASGIHMIIATQRPTKKVLSPIIKANMPVRVAFSVASAADSMTILDQTGAEDLLGKGDMIYLPKDRPRIRLQSGYVSDEETEKVINYLSQVY